MREGDQGVAVTEEIKLNKMEKNITKKRNIMKIKYFNDYSNK